MNFDILLSNPPYSNSLHLKFLDKYTEIAENIISIQPAEFILRPYIKPSWEKLKEKYKNSIGKHLYNLEIIKDANKIFNAGIDTELCIYELNNKGGFDYDNFYKTYDSSYLNNLDKFKTNNTIKDLLENYNDQKYFVPIRTDGIFERWWTLQLINYLDIINNGKIYSGDYKGLTIPEARKKNPHENPRNINRTTVGISFDSLEEAINFRDSVKTEAYLYIIALLKTTRKNPLDKLPIFDSYKNKWDNEKIFNLFNIDKDIRNKIIDLMQPFTKPTKNIGNTFIETKDKLKKL